MKLGPYETGRVYQGDCLELMKAIPDGSVPMIWTDPPYGHANNDGDLAASRVGTRGARKRPVEAIENDTAEAMRVVVDGMLDAAARLMRCCCCCCCCSAGGGPSPTFAWLAARMDARGLAFFHAVVWDKTARGPGLGWRYRRDHEFVMIAHRVGGRLAWVNRETATSNIVRTPPVRERVHPNEKPVALVEHFLRLHTAPGDLVLDPFAGAGTTGVACANLGREFLGFEIDPHWAEVANERIEAARRGVSVGELREGQATFDFGGKTA
jgi:DNA modification methylase